MTQLQQKWTLSYLDNSETKSPDAVYENAIHVIADFETVEEFWQVYSHIKLPSQIGTGNELHLFRDGYRAIWEDEANKNGGKWFICLKKDFSDKVWEKSVLSLIGEQFLPEVIGIVISERDPDILSFWIKSSEDLNLNKIANNISNVLGLPNESVLNFKAHDQTKKNLKTNI